MPYTGAADPKLPANVKKLPAAARRQWVATFNGVMGDCEGDDCEGRAMRIAHAAVKEVTGLCMECAEPDREGHKCSPDAPAHDMPMVMEAPPPLGGATNFAGVDQWHDSMKINANVDDQRYYFDQIVRNIWDADEDEMTLDQKAAAIAAAAQELSARIAAGPQQKGLAERVKEAVGLFMGGDKAEKIEGGITFRAGDYADVSDAAKPSTWKLRLAEGRSGNFTVAQVGRAITAMQPGGFRGNRVALGSPKGEVAGKISAAVGKIKGATDDQKKALLARLAKVKEMESGRLLFNKEASGAWRWLAVATNKFEDRDGELFAEAAHKEYEAWVDGTKAYPELWLWHVPGSRLGEADFVGYNDGFLLVGGTFDKDMGDVAERLAASDDLGVSHGYNFHDSDLSPQGVYTKYRMREVSVLPEERAANLWTAVSTEMLLEEAKMLSEQKRTFLTEKLGEDRAAALIGSLSVLGKELEGAGIRFKDLDEEVAPLAIEGEKPVDAAPATASADAKPLEEPAAALEQTLTTALEKALAPLAARLDALEGSVKALKATDDEKIAAALTPRAQVANGERPTESAENLADDKLAETVKAAGGAEGDLPTNPARPYFDMLVGRPRA